MSDRASFRALLAASLFIVLWGSAPGSAGAQLVQNLLSQPCTICEAQVTHTADLDGDGDADVLSAARLTSKIAWHENLDNGGLAPQDTIATDAANVNALSTADLDGDDDADVLAALGGEFGESPARVVWYENLDSGGFADAAVITTDVEAPQSVAAANFDGASDPDVLVAASDNGLVARYENLDDGFGAPDTLTAAAAGAETVTTADLDGDDDEDVLAAWDGDFSEEPLVAWFEHLDGGGFAAPDTIDTELLDPRDLLTADVDGDTDPDVVAATFDDTADPDIVWYENLDAGGLAERDTIATEQFGVRSLHAADLDGDDDPDVLAASSEGVDTEVAWYENLDADGFGDKNTIAVPDLPSGVTTQVAAKSVAAADVDGDGDPDPLYATQYGDAVARVENQLSAGTGFGDPVPITPPATTPGAESVHTVDLNGDGDRDVLVGASQGQGLVVWYEQLDTGGFAAADTVTTNASGIAGTSSAVAVQAADLDGDDDRDVLAATFTGLVWYENLDGGGFGDRTEIAGDITNAVHTADLDGDGDPDVLAGREGFFDPDAIVWYENLDSGGFSSATVISTAGGEPASVYAADLDGDEDPDVISGSDGEVAWYENLDSGGFSEQTVISETDDPREVTAAAVDGDDDQDVLTISSGKAVWHENDGGSFAAEQVISPDVSDVRTLATADLDENGTPDVVVGRQNNLAWYANGGGSFSDAKPLNDQFYGGVDVAAANLDGDGDPDIVSASERDGRVAWYRNTSAIPVELATFEGAQAGAGTVRLTWTTASEGNNAGFQVQRERNDGTWTTLGFVEGSGTTSRQQSYRFVANDLSVGTHRFRLKQEDLDGTTQVHGPLTVDLQMTQAVRLHAPAPNPVRQRTTLSFAVKTPVTTTLTLYDALGRTVATLYRGTPRAATPETVSLHADDLSSGVYFLRLRAGERSRTTRLTVVR